MRKSDIFRTVTQLSLRIALAVPFWRSGMLKWSGFFHLKDVTLDLFVSEFKLHLPGGPYAFPAPVLMAYLSGTVEIVMPVLLVVGLLTRPAALVLLLMTCVVELTVPDGWPIHITWAAMALAVAVYGAGELSLDRLVANLGNGLLRRGAAHEGQSVPSVYNRPDDASVP
jgi:putative oxidoreductase